jgi:hypothetical protein
MADFDAYDITIGYFTDDWGPFAFNLPSATSETANDGVLPFGATITAATIRAFVGTLDAGDDLTAYVEVTDSLIDTDVALALGSNSIYVFFKYPGDAYRNKRITLVFEVTLSTGAKQAFYFHSVVIS